MLSFMPSNKMSRTYAEFDAELLSLMPSKMSIAKFYAKFFEIKVLLLVQFPSKINWNLKRKTHKQTHKRHIHTMTYNNNKLARLIS